MDLNNSIAVANFERDSENCLPDQALANPPTGSDSAENDTALSNEITSTPMAAQRVLAIPELAHMIFMNVPARELLTSVNRVHSAIKTIIDENLQRYIFSEATFSWNLPVCWGFFSYLDEPEARC
jgi:hypothetical protein